MEKIFFFFANSLKHVERQEDMQFSLAKIPVRFDGNSSSTKQATTMYMTLKAQRMPLFCVQLRVLHRRARYTYILHFCRDSAQTKYKVLSHDRTVASLCNTKQLAGLVAVMFPYRVSRSRVNLNRFWKGK